MKKFVAITYLWNGFFQNPHALEAVTVLGRTSSLPGRHSQSANLEVVM